jgi:dipeptidyl aminopeptidase/acylaminoacyl peptidase
MTVFSTPSRIAAVCFGQGGCGALVAVAVLAGTQSATAQPDSAFSLPPEIERFLDVEPLPPIVADPTGRYALLIHERQLLPIDQLAEPAVEIAGQAINLQTGAAHAPIAYYGLTLLDLNTLTETPLALPHDAIVGYPRWSPDGSRFAFTLTRSVGTELWVGESASALARLLARSVDTARGTACSWLPDNHRLLCRFSTDREGRRQTLGSIFDRMAAQALPGEPTTLSDEQARRLLETQLTIVDATSGGRHSIGMPAAFESVVAAPAQAFLLVTRVTKPYPVVTGVDLAERVTEVWDRFGNVVARLPQNARAIEWQAAQPATLTWVEQREGSDRIVSLPAPFTGSAQERFELPHRFAGLRWIGDTAALVSDYDSLQRRTELWHVDFAGGARPRMVTGYGGGGQLPVTNSNAWGFDTVVVGDGGFYLRGTATADGRRRAFVDHIALATGLRRRVWEARGEANETLVDVLSPESGVVLTRRETSTTAPNYFMTSATGGAVALTSYDPAAVPATLARRIPLSYERDDGFDLSASLYLPPGHDPRRPLPLIVWAYPRQVSAAEAISVARTEEEAMTSARAFRLFFLLRGYAVLDDVSMPIVGSESEANDTFVQQVVANASAAIDAAAATGFVDRRRVGVAGHSYGAFMVANLLVHSRLFGAGVAMSGAYNRTLTPFGFQTERRTLWQAQQTYLAMSPLLFSDRIEAPLLLVHGLKDNNAGTSPQQSLQFYQAIRGNGREAELLLLPWEGHSYRALESVRKTAAHMLRWFDVHLKEQQSSSE